MPLTMSIGPLISFSQGFASGANESFSPKCSPPHMAMIAFKAVILCGHPTYPRPYSKLDRAHTPSPIIGAVT